LKWKGKSSSRNGVHRANAVARGRLSTPTDAFELHPDVASYRTLPKVRKEQSQRAAALEREREADELRATLIEYNLERVDVALAAVNNALAGGMGWGDLEIMIREETRAGNPVAGTIKSLDLANNKITVTLANHLDDDEDDEDEEEEDGEDEDKDGDEDDAGEGDDEKSSERKRKQQQKKLRRKRRKAVAVELDLSLSAYANARTHFEKKKKHATKHDKTLAQTERAVAAAEKKAKADFARVRARPTHWSPYDRVGVVNADP
jgi:predicted ribosome quality control (RQC) complex YloA/Tae2 family protein